MQFRDAETVLVQPGVSDPRFEFGDFAGVVATSLLVHGAAPSLHSWRLDTVDFVPVLKFDEKLLLAGRLLGRDSMVRGKDVFLVLLGWNFPQ